jgi:FkbM family methyltransferase
MTQRARRGWLTDRNVLRISVARVMQLAVRHLPPRRKGLSVVGLVERVIPPPAIPMRAKHISGFTVTCDLSDSVHRSLFYKGTMEERASAELVSVLSEGDTFLDLGANAGHFVFLAARAVGSGGHVHAVEAGRTMARQLHEDVMRNGLDATVTVHHVAVADAPGVMVLQEAPGASRHGQRFLDPSGSTVGETVEVTTVDRLLPGLAPAAVKVDVEGADLRTLHGMREMLEARPPRLLLVEAIDRQLARFGDSSDDLVAYLTAFGYAARDVSEEEGARELCFVHRSDSR